MCLLNKESMLKHPLYMKLFWVGKTRIAAHDTESISVVNDSCKMSFWDSLWAWKVTIFSWTYELVKTTKHLDCMLFYAVKTTLQSIITDQNCNRVKAQTFFKLTQCVWYSKHRICFLVSLLLLKFSSWQSYWYLIAKVTM